MVHTITLNNYIASCEDKYLVLGTYDSYGIEKIRLVLENEWEEDGLVICAVFSTKNTKTEIIVPDNLVFDVPQEATSEPSSIDCPGTIVFYFVDRDGTKKIVTNDVFYVVSNHSDIKKEESEPTLDKWAQFVSQVKRDAEVAEVSVREAENSAMAASKSELKASQSADSAKLSADSALKSEESANLVLDQVKQAETDVVSTIDTAKNDAVNAVESAKTEAVIMAVNDIDSAKTTAVNDLSIAKESVIQEVSDSKDKAVQSIQETENNVISSVQQESGKQQLTIQKIAEEAGLGAKEEVGSGAQAALSEIDSAKMNAVSEINSTVDSVKQEIATEGNTVLESISTAKQNAELEIHQIVSGTSEDVGNAGAAQVTIVQEEGARQTKSVSDAGQSKIDEINAINSLLPIPTESDAGKILGVDSNGGFVFIEIDGGVYSV